MKNKEFLAKWYEEKGPKWCAEVTGLSYESVKQSAHMMGLRWDKAKRYRIGSFLRDNLKDKGWAESARELGLAEGTVRRWAKKLGIEGLPDGRGSKPKVLTKEQQEMIRSEYPAKSCQAVASDVGLSRDVVEMFLRDEGLYIGMDRYADLAVNKSFFEWSEDLAYVLGYMFADGSVGRYLRHELGRSDRVVPNSSITSKDRQILDDIRDRMGLKADVCSYKKNGENYHHLTTSCRWVYNQWRELGVRPRKSYEGMGVPNIPSRLVSHFVRGFFDGDGSRSGDGYSIKFGCTDVNFILWIRGVLMGVVGGREPEISVVKNKTIFFSFAFYADRARKIYEWMMPSKEGLRLKRKWMDIA